MRKTKIVCTLGPSTNKSETLKKMINAGMNVARINFSHGTYEEHEKTIKLFKTVTKEVGKPIALLLDTKGPEIRVSTFENGYVELQEGEEVTFSSRDIKSTSKEISISYKDLPKDVSINDRILIDDGLISCRVLKTSPNDIVCVVENGGRVSDRKSINVPDVSIKMPYMSAKDKEDLKFGIKHDVDFVAASFVRTASDVLEVRKFLDENNGGTIRIIAKIENREGVDNIDEIIKVSDGIMVARGDMGVEVPLEELPSIQKMLIKKCFMAGKVAITATQLLDSMIRNPRPTRAETTDVANAVYDGTSALMLSGETAIGKYPVESVETMSRIAVRTESVIDYKKRFSTTEFGFTMSIGNAICHATCTTAHDLGASAIIAVSKSGHTARMLSRFRPSCPIVATVLNAKIQRQLNLSWGVLPCLCEEKDTTDELFKHVVDIARSTSLVDIGDLVVITAGIPVGIGGNTNILKVHLVGDVLVQGVGVNNKCLTGNLFVAKNESDAKKNFVKGSILVIPRTSNDIMDVLKNATGIIVEDSGVTNHSAIVGAAFDIPVIVDAKNATNILKTGTTITMDSSRGLVISGVIDLSKNKQ